MTPLQILAEELDSFLLTLKGSYCEEHCICDSEGEKLKSFIRSLTLKILKGQIVRLEGKKQEIYWNQKGKNRNILSDEEWEQEKGYYKCIEDQLFYLKEQTKLLENQTIK